MKNIFVQIIKKIKINYNKADIKKYLGNVSFLLFILMAMQIYDYFTQDIYSSFLEAILSGLVVFFILTVVYSIFSPTLWGYFKKNREDIKK